MAALCVQERALLAEKLVALGATRRIDGNLAAETCFDVGHPDIVLSVIIDPDMSGNSDRSREYLSLEFPVTVLTALIWTTGDPYTTDADNLNYSAPQGFGSLTARASSNSTVNQIYAEIKRVTAIFRQERAPSVQLIG